MNATVKTFRAPDPRSALEAVKAAFGDEAVIIQTREIPGGILGKRQIEITAASSGEVSRRPGATGRTDLETEIAALRRVVGDLRTELRATREEPRDPFAEMPPHAVRTCRQLMSRGMEDDLAEELVRNALRDAPNAKEAELVETLGALLRARLPATRAPWDTAGRRVMALVGPTGVGKTTTIAKIAARALLETRLKVSLVTVDTYRIGASEHIGRYGEIMGVPTHIARDAAGLKTAIGLSESADLILIDTAGRSDPGSIQAQGELLRAVPEIEIHLVLSSASGTRELRAAARRHQVLRPNRLIFTKLDEADGPGAVTAPAADLGCPISCVTDGQRVPEDVHSAHPRLLDFLLSK